VARLFTSSNKPAARLCPCRAWYALGVVSAVGSNVIVVVLLAIGCRVNCSTVENAMLVPLLLRIGEDAEGVIPPRCHFSRQALHNGNWGGRAPSPETK
jgi:hypothetical protein